MKRALTLIAVVLFVGCQRTGDGRYGVYNAYGKWEPERTMDFYVDRAQERGRSKYKTIGDNSYLWGDSRWERKLADRINYLENQAAERGYLRDWYVDFYLSEGESWGP